MVICISEQSNGNVIHCVAHPNANLFRPQWRQPWRTCMCEIALSFVERKLFRWSLLYVFFRDKWFHSPSTSQSQGTGGGNLRHMNGNQIELNKLTIYMENGGGNGKNDLFLPYYFMPYRNRPTFSWQRWEKMKTQFIKHALTQLLYMVQDRDSSRCGFIFHWPVHYLSVFFLLCLFWLTSTGALISTFGEFRWPGRQRNFNNEKNV